MGQHGKDAAGVAVHRDAPAHRHGHGHPVLHGRDHGYGHHRDPVLAVLLDIERNTHHIRTHTAHSSQRHIQQ
jgi:hypothetical protein